MPELGSTSRPVRFERSRETAAWYHDACFSTSLETNGEGGYRLG
jgi:hypothetical protein